MLDFILHKTPAIFFTVALAQPGSDLLLREINLLRQAVRLTRAERPFVINAWVVLPDHVHAIWTLPDSDHATRWRLIKSRFSASLPKDAQHLRSRGTWQPRFWQHDLRGPADMAAHLRMCRNDPARHGLVQDGADWPYSSFWAGHEQRLAG